MQATNPMNSQDALAFDSEHRLRQENLSWDIDVWYPSMQSATFPSIFLPLKLTEAKAIIAFNNVSWRRAQSCLTEEELSNLILLENDIDDAIKHTFGSEGAFIRLCGRSPKEAEPLNRKNVHEDYSKALREVLNENGKRESPLSDADSKHKIEAIGRVTWLRVRNGKEAMSLLLTSERVYAEMLDWVRFGEPEQVCLRKWDSDLTMENEFRCFVCRGNLTAISQYDHYAFYPRLHPRKEKLLEGITNYLRQVHPFVCDTSGSYVIDIGYRPSHDDYIVIELGPFSPCTGAALFCWKEDKHVLEGTSSFQFRLKEECDLHPNLEDLIKINWEDRWSAEVAPYWTHYSKTAPASQIYSTAAAIDLSSQPSLWASIQSLWRLMTWSSQPTSIPSSQPAELIHNDRHLNVVTLFVYGTLKRGFHWNSKYLSPRLGARYVGPATTTRRYPLVIGDCGVPYLLGDLPDTGHRLLGELWEVSLELLQGLDDYEGLSKGYYSRECINVLPLTADTVGDGSLLHRCHDAVEESSHHECPGDNNATSAIVAAHADAHGGEREGVGGSCFHGLTSADEGEAVATSSKQAFVYMLRSSSESLRGKEYIPEYTLEMHRRLYQAVRHIQTKQFAYIGAPSGWGKATEMLEGMLDPTTS